MSAISPGVAGLMLAMGIEEPEEMEAIWSALQPLRIARTPMESIDQIRAVQEGRAHEYLPFADEEPTPEPTHRDPEDARDELLSLIEQAPSGEDIWDVIYDLAVMLLKKNISYGNSALEPIRVLSKASTGEQLLVRADDKLSRLRAGESFPGDNDIDDTMGYLVLFKVWLRRGGAA